MGYPTQKDESYQTVITKISSYNEATGWFVGRTGRGNVVGVSQPKPPVNTPLTLFGYWKDDPKWGRQFRVNAIKYSSSRGAILALLKGGFIKYVKDSMAETIADTLGDTVFSVLNGALEGDADSIARFNAIKGVGKVTGPAILESWRQNRHWAQNALVCIRAGLTLHQSKQATIRFGEDLKDIIFNNPYKLTVIRGITWETVDRIAQETWEDKQPIPHDSPHRYAAAVREALRQGYGDGHVCLPYDMAMKSAKELATPSNADTFEEIVMDIAKDEEIVLDGGYLYNKDEYDTEKNIAQQIGVLRNANIKTIDWNAVLPQLEKFTAVTLSEDQMEAVKTAITNPVTVITGGPGTGKTTISNTIVNILSHYGNTITLCAPTGKAAIRLSKATGMGAQTIHRALGLPINENDLMTDVVIVDEASMIDQDLFHKLVSHVKTGARFILVGDADQLPPVGAGEPFYQIIQSDIPVVRLNVIHRQGKNSGIVVSAHEFNKGNVPSESFEDCKIEYAGANEQLQKRAIGIYEDLLNSGVNRRDILLLTPVNGHDWGQQALNLALKGKYNPGLDNETRMPLCSFDVGDPVIHTKNNYELGVMNGEIGEVKSVLNRFQEMDAKIECEPGELPKVLTVEYDGKTIEYDRDDMGELKLAYSISIHKSQGSESPYVIMLVPTVFEGFRLRQLAYTGLTRAKKFAHLASTENALQQYVGNTERVRRYTDLARHVGVVHNS